MNTPTDHNSHHRQDSDASYTEQQLGFTTQIEQLFEAVRTDSEDHTLLAALAQEAHGDIHHQLMLRHGHENPVDWYDHPTATILALGQAAADRVSCYTNDDHPDTNQRLQEWNQIIRAYSFCLQPDAGNQALRAVDKFGQYESATVVFD